MFSAENTAVFSVEITRESLKIMGKNNQLWENTQKCRIRQKRPFYLVDNDEKSHYDGKYAKKL